LAEGTRPREVTELRFLVPAGVSVRSAVETEGGVIRDVPAATPPDEVEAVALRALFSKTFPQDPEGAVDWLTKQVSWGSSRRAAAEVLLPYAVKASYAQQSLVCPALLELATPDDLIHAALAAYGRDDDPRLLKSAAAFLEHYDTGVAWPALERLARSGRPECRYFVGTIAEMGVSTGARQQALAALARNPDVDTRREVLETLEGGWPADPLPVWRVLAEDPDRAIRDLAQDRLASLAAE
jgi:hypothetical protein